MRDLDRLAESHGIQIRYVSELDEAVAVTDTAKRELLAVLGVDPDTGEEGSFAGAQHETDRACAFPDALASNRRWGVSCQLYALRSARSLGMGDFADLAHLAEICGAAGAAFLGVNPLHALFFADPGRYGPYSPSTRRFLNAFYVAVDRLPGGEAAVAALRAEDPASFEGLDGDLVDYGRAGALKARLLRGLFDAGVGDDEAFAAFIGRNGEALRDFALFEALSAREVAEGRHAGWHNWPEPLRERGGEAVARFAAENAAAIRFHMWLQFVADRQLAEAQARALGAGMAIGLYLDFAVGVSPDGAETWSDPDLVVPTARVGAPPDMFNSAGQDWGLAPLSPEKLASRNYRPLRDAYAAMMANAGAVRIDHAMGLARLWWIPHTGLASGGGYVRYPLGAMIDAVADVSSAQECLVVGEDLGTVPDGFREAMERARILAYRVLYFERWNTGAFKRPDEYPPLSLACISTHDLATLRGWWAGADITLRAETGRQSAHATQRDLETRAADRLALLRALDVEGLLTPDLAEALSGRAELPAELPAALAVAVHRYGARTKAALFAVQVDDMILGDRQPNLPGTTDEYPNWRIRSGVMLEDLADDPRFGEMARAMRDERPESPLRQSA